MRRGLYTLLIGCLLTCSMVTGCATSGESGVWDDVEPREGAKEFEPPSESPVSMALEEEKLGDAVRQIGQEFAGSLVVMNGIEEWPLPATRFTRADFTEVSDTLSAVAYCAVEHCPSYHFIYPPGYELLTSVSMEGKLVGAYGDTRLQGPMAFGAGMYLSTVFGLMSRALDITIVGDNAIAESRTGEVILGPMTLEEALEAILKGARIPAFEVDSTDEYIFISVPQNRNPRSLMLNTGPLDPTQQAMLNAQVDVVLPAPTSDPNKVPAGGSVVGLRQVLGPLSQQLGVRVVAERGLEDIPIEAAVLNNVSVGTAMDLLVRQWPVPSFGYQVTSDRIVIRRRDRAGAPQGDAAAATAPAPPVGPGAEKAAADKAAAEKAAAAATPADEKPAPPATPPAALAAEPPANSRKVTYTVDFGDSAWTIAQRHDVPVRDLLRWNNLQPNSVLKAGVQLVVYVSEDFVTEQEVIAAEKAAAEKIAAEQKAAADKAAADKAAADKAAADKAA
ncbi:MAG: LysM peptidoglycan-binding domain-containing protein, partial [bacterium]|nr:LysM peptidoglycan-binding domain-containing protein [bacterium]